MTSAPNHYEVLGLPASIWQEGAFSKQILRNAYRRALLRHHPDKSAPGLSPGEHQKQQQGAYSVDQIFAALSTLSDERLRAKYDAELILQRNERGLGGIQKSFRTGVEVVDLDDLDMEELGNEEIWYKGCRCGDERGFLIREADLEEASRDGERELCVGCSGCSLWLRVQFGVVEEGQPGSES